MQHVLEKLAATNPSSEIWWDSSPLIYGAWADGVLKSAPEPKRAVWSEQLSRLLDPASVAESGEMGFRGVTTNPPLSLQAIKGDPARWVARIEDICRAEPSATVEDVYWTIYLEVVRHGAEMIRAVWDKSNGQYGFVSGQVDPRSATDYDAMLEQGLSIAAQGPNVMVKAPGSQEGYRIIEEMTARGISTNNTTSFSMPQYKACMDAVSRGLARARKDNVDLSRWRSVITHMSARLTGLGDLLDQASLRGIEISSDEAQLAELAIMKRAYHYIRETGHPSKMLMCSMRVNKDDGSGRARSLHIEKLAGGDFVYTCPPSYIAALMEVEDRLPEFDPQAIDEELAPDLYDRLMRIPYFRQAYEPDGMEPHQFSQFGPFISTAGEFAKATRQTIDFVANVMEKVKNG
jgi:transaldolase